MSKIKKLDLRYGRVFERHLKGNGSDMYWANAKSTKENKALISGAVDMATALERALPWLKRGLAEELEKGTAAPNDLGAVVAFIENILAKQRGGQ